MRVRQLICIVSDHETYCSVLVIDAENAQKLLQYNINVLWDEEADRQMVEELHEKLFNIGCKNPQIEHFSN